MVRSVGGPKIHSNWSASAGQLVFTRDNASVGITWGEDGSGIDTTWFGETAGVKMQWVVSGDELTFTGCAVNIASASLAGAFAVASGGNITFSGASTMLRIDEVASRGAITASSPDHYISIGLIASGSVITGLIPVFASA